MKQLHCDSSVKGFLEILKIKLNTTLPLPFNGCLLEKGKNSFKSSTLIYF